MMDWINGCDNINNIYDNGIGIGDADGRKLEELELMLELGEVEFQKQLFIMQMATMIPTVKVVSLM